MTHDSSMFIIFLFSSRQDAWQSRVAQIRHYILNTNSCLLFTDQTSGLHILCIVQYCSTFLLLWYLHCLLCVWCQVPMLLPSTRSSCTHCTFLGHPCWWDASNHKQWSFIQPPPPKKMWRLHDEGLIVYYLKKLFLTPRLDSPSRTEPKPDMLSAVSTGNRIWLHGKISLEECHVHLSMTSNSISGWDRW